MDKLFGRCTSGAKARKSPSAFELTGGEGPEGGPVAGSAPAAGSAAKRLAGSPSCLTSHVSGIAAHQLTAGRRAPADLQDDPAAQPIAEAACRNRPGDQGFTRNCLNSPPNEPAIRRNLFRSVLYKFYSLVWARSSSHRSRSGCTEIQSSGWRTGESAIDGLSCTPPHPAGDGSPPRP